MAKNYTIRATRCDCGNDTFVKTVTLTGVRIWECGNCRKTTPRRKSVYRVGQVVR